LTLAALNDAASEFHGQAGRRPLAACAGALAVTVVLLSGLMAPLGYWHYGWAAVWSVVSAGLLCGLTGLVAFWTAHRCQAQGEAISGVLAAMGIRMGIPLAICLIVALRGSADSFAGFVYYLLVFYLATLAVETWYSLPAGAVPRAPSARE
jgi:hypothetical protein